MAPAKRAREYDKRAKAPLRLLIPSPPDEAGTLFWDEELVFPRRRDVVAVQRKIQADTTMHSHAFTELVFIVSGTGTHIVDDYCYSLSPGDFYVISGPQSHAYQDSQQLHLINVIVRNEFMRIHRPEFEEISGGRHLLSPTFRRSRTLSPEEFDDCLRLVERIEQEISGFREGSAFMQSALVMELLLLTCRRVKEPVNLEDIHRASIAKALSYAEHHYGEDIGVMEMARAAGMSARSFQRHFKAMVGMPPLRHLQQLRIANCCRLLRETRDSVQSIAANCGIPESAYFCRLFRRVTGTTPGAFRKGYVRPKRRAMAMD